MVYFIVRMIEFHSQERVYLPDRKRLSVCQGRLKTQIRKIHLIASDQRPLEVTQSSAPTEGQAFSAELMTFVLLSSPLPIMIIIVPSGTVLLLPISQKARRKILVEFKTRKGERKYVLKASLIAK